MASLCKLLELLAPVQRPLSELVAELPAVDVVHRQLPCPWALKGLVMRVLTERLKGRELDLTDGIKVLRRTRLGARCCPTRTSRSSTSMPRETTDGGLGRARGRAAGARRAGRWRGRNPPPASANLKFRLNLRAARCFNARRRQPPQKGCSWKRSPDLALALRRRPEDLIKELEARGERDLATSAGMLHGKIDILRAELVARLQQQGEEELAQVDVDRLTDILAGKAAPPASPTADADVSHVYCPECGFQNPEAANYCARCGAMLVTEGSGDRDDADLLAPRRSRRRIDELDESASKGRRSSSAPAADARASSFPLEGERTTIGRTPDCDIFLDDVTVSRRHARARRRATARLCSRIREASTAPS